MDNSRIILITGANRGLGLETARQLGMKEANSKILLGVRDKVSGKDVEEELREQGIDAKAIKLDVTKSETIKKAVKKIEKKYSRLDVLINNAGILLDDKTNVADASIKDWKKTFDTNLLGVVEVTTAFLSLLRKSQNAAIVNISSSLGSMKYNSEADDNELFGLGYYTAYNASKAALNMYTIHLAHALKGEGIKVNAAHPGWVKTRMGGDGATMPVSEGAKTSVKLATLPDTGSTGIFIHMDEVIPW
jgi:NAD(P)-dependent dehydrogenase (short-subunit alcohol dehydrogenase family)